MSPAGSAPNVVLEREADALASAATSGQMAAGPPTEMEPTADASHYGRPGGGPLPEPVRGEFEALYGHDFGAVRLHAGGAAAAAAHDVDARAFTIGRDIVFGAGELSPHSDRGRHLLAHELAHVVQQSAGVPMLQRQPAEGKAAEAAPDDNAPLFTQFIAEERRRTDRRFARRLGRADAARLRKSQQLSTEDRQELNGKLRFFDGAAKDEYVRAIRPALVAVTRTPPPHIEMTSDDAIDRAAPVPSPFEIPSMSQGSAATCAGRPCVDDRDIMADIERSRAEDAAVEQQAIDRRIARITTEKVLEVEVYKAQRGTRQHRHARERLETFRQNGVDPGPYVNIEGGPGPANIGFGVLAAVGGGAAALGAAWTALVTGGFATLTTTTATVMTNPVPYMAASLGYGIVAPPGSPDFPGPFDDAGRALRALGVAAHDAAEFGKGVKVWGELTRGNARLVPYFIKQTGKLVAGVQDAHWHGDKEGIVRAFLTLRKEANALAKSLGATTIRLEADVVTNTEVLLPNLLKMGFKESAENPFTFFLDIAVK